jgi:hypothetical protein
MEHAREPMHTQGGCWVGELKLAAIGRLDDEVTVIATW